MFVSRCKICGLVYNNRVPDKKSLKFIYQKLLRSLRSENETHIKNTREQGRFVRKNFNFDKLISLDVGSANDSFSEILRRYGWKSFELDPSEDLYKEDGSSETIIKGTIEEFKSSKKFDLISMRHVLEHLLDPESSFLKIRSLLKKNGMIFIEVPNIWESKPVGILSFFNFLHLTHFSPVSCENLLKKTGFSIIAFEKTQYSAMRILARTDDLHSSVEFKKDNKVRFVIEKYMDLEKAVRNDVINKVKQIISKKGHIVLWGAGMHSEEILRSLPNKFLTKVNFLVDKDPKKWHKLFYRKIIKEPGSCLSNKDPIIISSLISKESIKKDMQNLGIDENRIVDLYEDRFKFY